MTPPPPVPLRPVAVTLHPPLSSESPTSASAHQVLQVEDLLQRLVPQRQRLGVSALLCGQRGGGRARLDDAAAGGQKLLLPATVLRQLPVGGQLRLVPLLQCGAGQLRLERRMSLVEPVEPTELVGRRAEMVRRRAAEAPPLRASELAAAGVEAAAARAEVAWGRAEAVVRRAEPAGGRGESARRRAKAPRRRSERRPRRAEAGVVAVAPVLVLVLVLVEALLVAREAAVS